MRQKMIELHQIKTKQGEQKTMSEKVDIDLRAIQLSLGYICTEMQTLMQTKIGPKNM